MLDALQKWREQGYQVKIAMPFDIDLSKKFDFNDLLKTQGERAVRTSLTQAIEVTDLSQLKSKSSSLSQDFIKIQDQTCSKIKQNFDFEVMVSSKQKNQELSL